MYVYMIYVSINRICILKQWDLKRPLLPEASAALVLGGCAQLAPSAVCAAAPRAPSRAQRGVHVEAERSERGKQMAHSFKRKEKKRLWKHLRKHLRENI